jgi:hypothetical protein
VQLVTSLDGDFGNGTVGSLDGSGDGGRNRCESHEEHENDGEEGEAEHFVRRVRLNLKDGGFTEKRLRVYLLAGGEGQRWGVRRKGDVPIGAVAPFMTRGIEWLRNRAISNHQY